ncbi:MAG TPA: RDD family protein, partial [Candidatus Brocadiia bacterium]|nr:RDD family protein [Candidatus Brocadiia bacterium]
GPVPESQLRQWIATGALSPATLVWTPGMDAWAPAPAIPGLVLPAIAQTAPDVRYGGFWIRFVAVIIDGIVLYPVQSGVQDIWRESIGAWGHSLAPGVAVSGAILGAWGLSAATSLVYETFLTASLWQGTVGKKVLGLRVSDVEGRRLSFGRSLGRAAAKYVSAATLMIGYMMAGWTRRKQALHDFLADTVVTRGGARTSAR